MIWQTIEGCPKDGTPFLAVNHDGEVWVARHFEGRLMFRTHRMVETRRWFSKKDDDGEWLREDNDWEHRKDEWRNDWTIWTRGYEFKPTMWMELVRPPAPATIKSETTAA